MPPTRTTSKKSSVRLVIADDHPIFRDGLRRLLEVEPDFKVVGEASNGEEALKLINDLAPTSSCSTTPCREWVVWRRLANSPSPRPLSV